MLTRTQKVIIWAIDLGFIIYWLLISLNILPAESMFAGYEKPEVQAWNWSFLPIDILAALTGIVGNTTSHFDKKTLLTISLVLTSVAGGMAVSYWALIGYYELSWWLPNLLLLLFPIWPLTNFIRESR